MLTYDCGGHGASPRTPGPYTASGFARDLAELFDHIGWDTAAVAGCSMGGNIAQVFAAEYPQRTDALGLIDTTAWYGADAPVKFKERAETAKANGMRGMIDFQLTRWFSDEFRSSHPDVLKKTTPQALRLYLLDVHYRRPFDHDEERLDRARRRAEALDKSLGRGRLGPIERDSSTQDVLAALDDDLHAERAIRALEKHARRDLAPDSTASLRTIARKVLGIL